MGGFLHNDYSLSSSPACLVPDCLFRTGFALMSAVGVRGMRAVVPVLQHGDLIREPPWEMPHVVCFLKARNHKSAGIQ